MKLDGFVPPLLIALLALVILTLRRVRTFRRRSPVFDAMALVVLLVAVSGSERSVGRDPTYARGPLRVWSGDTARSENSQQLFDPYTFTHVSHGIAFYAVTRLALGPQSVM